MRKASTTTENPNAGALIEPLYVRLAKVGEVLPIGQTKIAEMVRDGTLESVKVGRSRLITMRSIRALADLKAA